MMVSSTLEWRVRRGRSCSTRQLRAEMHVSRARQVRTVPTKVPYRPYRACRMEAASLQSLGPQALANAKIWLVPRVIFVHRAQDPQLHVLQATSPLRTMHLLSLCASSASLACTLVNTAQVLHHLLQAATSAFPVIHVRQVEPRTPCSVLLDDFATAPISLCPELRVPRARIQMRSARTRQERVLLVQQAITVPTTAP